MPNSGYVKDFIPVLKLALWLQEPLQKLDTVSET